MTADSEGSGDPAPEAPAGSAPAPSAETTTAESSTETTSPENPDAAAVGAADAEGSGAPEDVKAKFREALAHKHSSHGATHTEHGDKGAGPHGPEQAHGHRMFRRKAGG